uniref:SCAN box domain-containing protein n=1 Tax=Crocodylus porosus TaxID=8502 RepID=A0A7M4E7D7_CROPO
MLYVDTVRTSCAKWTGEAVNYDKVKKEIMYCLNINPKRYCQAFQMKRRIEDKFPRVLLQHLADLLEKWFKPQEVCKVELCDQILLEQFLMDLDKGTQCWVCHHHLKSSVEVLRLAKDFDRRITPVSPEIPAGMAIKRPRKCDNQ